MGNDSEKLGHVASPRFDERMRVEAGQLASLR